MVFWLLACGGGIQEPTEPDEVEAPEVTRLELSPSVLYTDSVVNADADVDDITQNIQLTYDWYVNDELVQSDAQSSLSGDLHFDRGDMVYVSVTPSLDENFGEMVTSETLEVRNSPPQGGEASFFPLSPIPQRDDLQCIAQPPQDADEDVITTSIRWFRNGQAVGGGLGTTLIPDDTLPAPLILSGDEIRCVITFSDGEEEVEAEVSTTAFGYTGWPNPIINDTFIDLAIVGEAGSMLGMAMASPGDLDGDGLAELLVSAPEEASVYFRGGAVYFFRGSTIAAAEGSIDLSQADLVIRGDGYGHRFGSAFRFDGDFDGDELPDLLISAKDGYMGCESGPSCLGVGQVYLFTGAQLMESTSLSPIDAVLHFEGFGANNGQNGVQTGSGIAFADMDDDGVDDIVIAASDEETSVAEGNVYIFLNQSLPSAGSVGILDFDYRIHGQTGEHLGASITRLHDVDGDSVDDLLIGSASDCSTDAVAYVLRAVDLGSNSEAEPSKTIYSSAGCSQIGYRVSSAGYFDDDERDDILITAPEYNLNAYQQGAVFVVGSKDLFSINELDVESDSILSFVGPSENDRLGSGFFEQVGDVNLDGAPDFLYSAHTSSFFEPNAGRVFLALSPDYSLSQQMALVSTHQFRPSFANEQLGASSVVQDFNGDGLLDIVLSAPGANGFSGKLFFYFSPKE